MAGLTTARGYGHRHQQIRAALVDVVASGTVRCTRCKGLIGPGEPWDLDHSEDRASYNGPAHRRCNRRAGAVKRNRMYAKRPARQGLDRSRVW